MFVNVIRLSIESIAIAMTSVFFDRAVAYALGKLKIHELQLKKEQLQEVKNLTATGLIDKGLSDELKLLNKLHFLVHKTQLYHCMKSALKKNSC